MTLKIGDMFKQWFPGGKLWFEVLDINREENKVKVKCYSPEGYSHEEEWDDLDVTELCFETGEYKMID